MSSNASVAVEFDLGVQNATEANRTVINGKNSLEFGSGKYLAKLRFMQDLSRIKPQMIQKVLSSIGISEDKNADFAHVNRQAERFNGRYEASNHIEMLESFRVSMGSGFGSNPRVTENKITLPSAFGVSDTDSRSLPVKALQQQSTAQLTIFYDGAMKVYDVPTEKAQAIMRLASANSSNNARTSTISSSKIEQISKTLPSKPASKAAIENQIPRPPVAGLQIVRKLSLQRFLQRRKERSNSVAPYTTMKPARSPSKSEKDSDEQIILSLATSGQNFKTSVNGGWLKGNNIIRQTALQHWFQQIQKMKSDFDRISFQHQYREYNLLADALSKEGLSIREGYLMLKEISDSTSSHWEEIKIY